MEQDIRDELADAQNDYVTSRDATRKRRQDIVMKARDAGNSKYAIAKAMNVRAPIVDSIIETAEREQGGHS